MTTYEINTCPDAYRGKHDDSPLCRDGLPVCVVDLDGVIYDWANSFNNAWIAHGNGSPERRINWLHFDSHVGLSAIDAHMTTGEYVAFDLANLEAIYGTHQLAEFGVDIALHRLWESCQIVFMTARPQQASKITIDFLENIMDGREYRLSFQTDKSNAAWYDVEYAIDDSPKHVIALASIPSIKFVALRRQPWNTKFLGADQAKIVMMSWFSDFVDLVEFDILSSLEESDLAMPETESDLAMPVDYFNDDDDDEEDYSLCGTEDDHLTEPSASDIYSLARDTPEALDLISDSIRYHAGRSELIESIARSMNQISEIHHDNDPLACWEYIFSISGDDAVQLLDIMADIHSSNNIEIAIVDDEVRDHDGGFRIGASQLRSLAKHNPDGLSMVAADVMMHMRRSELLNAIAFNVTSVLNMNPSDSEDGFPEWMFIVDLPIKHAVSLMSVVVEVK